MKKDVLLREALLFILSFLLAPAIYAQKTFSETISVPGTIDIMSRTGANGIFSSVSVLGDQTSHYCYDSQDNKVKHGLETVKGELGLWHKDSKVTRSLNYSYGRKNGKITQSTEISAKLKNGTKGKLSYQLNGEYKNDLMVGTWVIKHKGTIKYEKYFDETSNLTFAIKDRKLVSFDFDYKGWDDSRSKIKLTSDANGRVSGSIEEEVVKNNFVINSMVDKNGNTSGISPKAKNLLEEIMNDRMLKKELIENGYVLTGVRIPAKDIIDDALGKGLSLDNKWMLLDEDIKLFDGVLQLHQIKDNEWADFSLCKRWLDQEKDLDSFIKRADHMIENYEDNKYYLKPEVVQAVQDYKSTVIEQRFANAKKTINGTNDLASLFSFVGMVSNDKMAFPVEKQRELDNAIDAKYTDLVAKMKINVEEEMDYVALVNFYNSNVEPVKKDMADSDARSIDASYQKRRGELEKTVSAKILDEISMKESSKDLKEYYSGILDVVVSLPTKSLSISSAYDNKYAELVKKEEKAERKAARRSKVIKTLEWVGVGVAVVGGYLIYKYVLPEKQ